MKISLRRRQALMVEDDALSRKIDYILIFQEILTLEEHPNCITGGGETLGRSLPQEPEDI